jgi:hypothetical protein
MLHRLKINYKISGSGLLTAGDIEFHNLSASVCEKLEKQSLQPFWDHPKRLLVRHSFSNSEVLGLLPHVIVVNVEHHMLPL